MGRAIAPRSLRSFAAGNRIETEFNGRKVEIYLDPYDQTNYYVDLDPLLPEIVRRRAAP